jgi:dipeptide/tripeptide permease
MGVVVAGSLGLVGAPLVCLWLASRIGGSAGLAVAAVGSPLVLGLWAFALHRANQAYLRVSGDRGRVLELSVSAVVLGAVIALLVWTLLLGARGPDVPLRIS